MAAAIPAVGAFFASVGSTVTFGLATGIGASLIGGALVGAAIGGLTSLVTGGDLGKGLLFGALGGAVVGGLSGLTLPTVGTAAGTAMEVADLGYELGFAVQGTGKLGAASTGLGAASKIAGGGALSGMTAEQGLMYGMAGSTLIEGGLGLAGNMMQGAGQQEMFEAQKNFQEEQAAADRALREKLAEMEMSVAEGQLGIEGEKLAEDIRQYDKTLEQRQKEWNEQQSYRYAELERPYTERKEMRQRSGAALEGIQFEEAKQAPDAPSIYEQVVRRNEAIA